MADLERLTARIRRALSQLSVRRLQVPVLGDAAVLIPILLVAPRPLLLLTRRSENVGSHKGQVSFPGGMRDEGESDPARTALRETSEELGVNTDKFEVLGQFHEYLSITNYRVSPVIATRYGVPSLRPNQLEVARVLKIPLRFFLETKPRTEIRHREGRDITIYFYEYQEELVWGLTAAIIHDFCAFLHDARVLD